MGVKAAEAAARASAVALLNSLGVFLCRACGLARAVVDALPSAAERVAECATSWKVLVRAVLANRPLAADVHPLSFASLRAVCATVTEVAAADDILQHMCGLFGCADADGLVSQNVLAGCEALDSGDDVRRTGGGPLGDVLASGVVLAAAVLGASSRGAGAGGAVPSPAVVLQARQVLTATVSFAESVIRKCEICVTPHCLWLAQHGVATSSAMQSCLDYWAHIRDNDHVDLRALSFEDRMCPCDLMHRRNTKAREALMVAIEACGPVSRRNLGQLERDVLCGETFVDSLPRCGVYVRAAMPTNPDKGCGDSTSKCNKSTNRSTSKTPGVMLMCCPHGVTLGVSVLGQYESPAVVHRMLRERIPPGTLMLRASLCIR